MDNYSIMDGISGLSLIWYSLSTGIYFTYLIIRAGCKVYPRKWSIYFLIYAGFAMVLLSDDRFEVFVEEYLLRHCSIDGSCLYRVLLAFSLVGSQALVLTFFSFISGSLAYYLWNKEKGI